MTRAREPRAARLTPTCGARSSDCSQMSDDTSPSPDAWRDEVIAMRTENARQHAAVIGLLNKGTGARGGATAARARVSASKGHKASNIKRVASKGFTIPIGPGAEETSEFCALWAAVMGSSLVYGNLLKGFMRLIPWIINEKGNFSLMSHVSLVRLVSQIDNSG